jgi:hypothetical protein
VQLLAVVEDDDAGQSFARLLVVEELTSEIKVLKAPALPLAEIVTLLIV